MRVLFVNHGAGPGESRANVDAVLARCGGIFSKADYALPPVGLLSCATYVQARVPGLRSGVVDLSVEELHGAGACDRLCAEEAEVLVSTPATSSLERDLDLCRRWQERGPGRWVVSVGSHATEEPASVLRGDRWAAVRGEPEVALSALLREIAERRVDGVRGVWRQEGGAVSRSPEFADLMDVEAAPIPDHRLLAAYHYSPPFARAGRFDLVLTSRGCPFGCVFCASQSVYGRRQRFRPVADVVSEVRHLADDCGVHHVGFWDDNLTTSRARTRELCHGLAALPARTRWICLSRVDTVDAELLREMAAAGCYQIQYGVESGSERVREALGKPQPTERIRRTFAETRRAGIETVAFFMLGAPGETEEEREQTMALALELDPDYVSFNACTPLPGAPLYADLPETRTALWGRMDARRAGPWLAPHGPKSADGLERDLRRAYRRFYLRPRVLLRQAWRLRSPAEARRLARAGWVVARRNLG